MPEQLKKLVSFRGDRLFNGAVSISWFGTDEAKSRLASEAFVSHRSSVPWRTTEDVGTGHGHSLMDTASFARSVVRRCYGFEDQPFTLAIAGYGHRKVTPGAYLSKSVECA